MSRNGSGTYTLPAGNPVVPSTVIATTWANNTMNDLASAMTDSVAADGQTPMTGPLNMNSNKVTNLATGTISGDGVNFAQFNTPTFGGAVVCSSTLLVTGATTITGGAIDGTTIGTTTRSTVKATTLDLGLSTQSVAIGQGDSSSIKNRIINGAMVIDQRNAGASVTVNVSSRVYGVDRWFGFGEATDGVFTIQQDNDVPVGFNNSLKVTTTTADASVGASQFYLLGQSIEGFNFADLNWGTANAKTITLSFWVRSSLTGQFGGSLMNGASDRSYPYTYTINAANTFEYKTVTIAGDTSGTWVGATNGIGANVWFDLGCGSSNIGTAGAWSGSSFYGATGDTKLISTLSATFYITGVQLEVGSQATGFEYRQYQQELALCQRYYYRMVSSVSFGRFGSGFNSSTVGGQAFVNFSVTMRSSPTALEQTGTAADYAVIHQATSTVCSAVPTFSAANTLGGVINFTVASGLTTGQGNTFSSASGITTAYLGWSAEL
jgi:hypothetical protein